MTVDLEAFVPMLASLPPMHHDPEALWNCATMEQGGRGDLVFTVPKRLFVARAIAAGIVTVVNTAPQMVKEIRTLRAEVRKLGIERDELLDAAGLACECPPAECDCAGCSYGRERANAG